MSQQLTSEQERMQSQRIKFVIEDLWHEYFPYLNVPPSRRSAIVEKIDALIKRMEKLCCEQMVTGHHCRQIHELCTRLEFKALIFAISNNGTIVVSSMIMTLAIMLILINPIKLIFLS